MKRILPAYPLWLIDPNFSIWSLSDNLNGGQTAFWSGTSRKTYGLVRFNGKTYCFLGEKEGALPLEQTEVNISSFTTDYAFKCEEFSLKVSFISPLLPNEPKLLSCPVCFTKYEVTCNGTLPEDFSVLIALDEEYCYDLKKAPVVGGVLPFDEFEVSFMTRQRNLIMSNANDCISADWGDIYLAGEECWFVTDSAINNYIKSGKMEFVQKSEEGKFIAVQSKEKSGLFLTGFDDKVSIFYFGEWLKSYYFHSGKTIIDALKESYKNYSDILERCNAFDKKLKEDCEKIGEGYYTLACASLRQSVAAHKLVKNAKGELLFLSKENSSNGCIGTVDVSYPSIPLYLLYNPELVNAMMAGIYNFARMDVWNFDFAPHDLGTYPWCCGQVYGATSRNDKYSCGMTVFKAKPRTHTMLYLRPAKSEVYDYNMQMPVEECGDMLIMTAAAMLAGANINQAKENFDLLEQWVKYLEKFGLQPENQLCTDDFAGHLANNVNLSIKALVGIEAFSIIAEKLEKHDIANKYKEKAKEFAREFKALLPNGVMPLSYGMENSYSLKYNLLFDKLFGFKLIEQEIYEQEVDFYINKNKKYGVPLDMRKNFLKTDWILWVATLTEDPKKREQLYRPILHFLEDSPIRIAFADLYNAEKGGVGMFARSVQGGIFAPLLCERFKEWIK